MNAAAADLLVDLGADPPPAFDRPASPNFSTLLIAAIERHPRHDLRMGEVPAFAAHFPDAVVGPPPDRLEMIEQRLLQSPSRSEYCMPPTRA